ncbi:MAG: hypothetical protein JXA67_21570, partial [Micromonosporaceae bacterium]|nr:hypothetical protein [Micromonosporaceae bacterium]
MRRFLLVGCGGSGGATLQFLMDQLRADLGMRGVHALPKGWQFVHLDVPIAPDGVGPGMPPTVPAQGGRYLGLAHPGANYPGIAQGVESRLRTAGELRQLVAWRPNPAAVGIPITDGAGQQRAIGRMLTIAKAQSIYEELSAAFTILHGHGVTGELSEVADRFSPMTSEQVHSAPVVLVVSSMAGGAGASMVLDVCRLLTLVDGYDPRATALFLFTPEVFGSLPRHARGGVDGNALAMLGELLAAQSGAAAAGDAAVLRAIGLPVPDGDTVPFGRVIPIGARVGASGAPFGDGSAAGVYRGLGRGLAALMLSGQATAEFIGFDLVNPTAVSTDQETVGWGLDVNALLWGSFGFASIGLGRERYAEYAAQRLARAAVDRLVDGHLQPGDSRPATDQLRALNDVKWRSFSQRVGVPVRVDAVRDWFVALLSDAALEPAAARVVEEMIGRRLHLTQPTEFRQWLPVLVRQVAQDSSRMAERVEALAYRWAFDWYCGLMERLEVELTQAIVDSGLAAGQDLLARAGDAVDGWVHTLRGPAGLAVEAHVLPDPTMRKLDGIKGLIDSTHASVQLLREGFTGSTLAAIRARCAGLAADLLQATRNDLLRPLMRACDAALEILVAARKAYPVDTGLARLRTDDYAAWPDGSTEIPRRFFEAHNELLLTSAQDFPAVFDANLAATQPGRPPRDALNAIVEGIIRGRWESAGQLVDSSIVQRLATFRPGVLPTDPRNPSGPPSPPRPGQYRIAVKPDELLERARAWVARPGEPFDVFISQSLRDYLLGGDAGDAELVR